VIIDNPLYEKKMKPLYVNSEEKEMKEIITEIENRLSYLQQTTRNYINKLYFYCSFFIL
jgi:hypothetical protein